MSHPVLNERHVLVVGPRLSPVAQEAMPAAKLEVAGPERLDLPETLHDALELIVIDVEAVDVDPKGGTVGQLAERTGADEGHAPVPFRPGLRTFFSSSASTVAVSCSSSEGTPILRIRSLKKPCTTSRRASCSSMPRERR